MSSHFPATCAARSQGLHLAGKHCVVNNEAVLLDILDTAGQEEYGRASRQLAASHVPDLLPSRHSAMREQWYRHGDGFILVFSITSRESFEEMTGMHQQIMRIKDVDTCPIVIVANKCDLEAQREVGVLEARALAKQLGCPFVEASAKEGINVDVAFFELVKLIRKDQKVRSVREGAVRWLRRDAKAEGQAVHEYAHASRQGREEEREEGQEGSEEAEAGQGRRTLWVCHSLGRCTWVVKPCD